LIAGPLRVSEEKTGQIFEEATRRKHKKTEMIGDIFL
jgi:hypothetical protein